VWQANPGALNLTGVRRRAARGRTRREEKITGRGSNQAWVVKKRGEEKEKTEGPREGNLLSGEKGM